MYVQVIQGEQPPEEVIVYGEKLIRHAEGSYFLPGRYVIGLRVDDLPLDLWFQLDGCLPSGILFFPEDLVTFGRGSSANQLHVQVTSRYLFDKWDGLFSLPITMEKRKQVIQESHQYRLTHFEAEPNELMLGFTFKVELAHEQDLESALEQICDQVRWVEEQGNRILLTGKYE
ncbi:hypothetical protein ACQCN2_06545 [Brevibacillus ginsengisoli]|uniref:hypothetical protein n=1 Tax=Brevibacillus ginsengisoli TaxID=363854 RepID=UPI003CE83A14